jgi:hypothetical protein
LFYFHINDLWIQNTFCAGVPPCFRLNFDEQAYSVKESRDDVVCKNGLQVLAEPFHLVLKDLPHLGLQLFSLSRRY